MKKDIKWLKAEVENLQIYSNPEVHADRSDPYTQYVIGMNDAVSRVKELLDQLDEPKVLSQELPVLPKYVAEYLEFTKEHGSLIKVMETASALGGLSTMKKVFGWISANDETFARAWLDGYEAEEEPLYHALIKGHELADGYDIYWNYDKSDDGVFVSRLHPPHDNFINEMSKGDWNKLGINDSNADFVKVEE